MEDNKKSIFEQNPKKTIILFVTFLLFTVFVLDVMLTMAYNYSQQREKKLKKLGVRHPKFHHSFKKSSNAEYTDILGQYTVFTNSLGFKDISSRHVPLKSEKHRILFMGDSFTEGILLGYEDTFVGIVDAKLSERQIEVLNAGRSHYSPIIYWRKMKYLIEDVGLKFNEVVLFIDLSDPRDEMSYSLAENMTVEILDELDRDQQNAAPTKGFVISVKHFIFFNTTLTYPALNYLYDSFGFVGQTGDEWSHLLSEHPWSMWTLDERIYSEYAEDGVKSMRKYMDKLLKLLKNNEIDLTIAVYPHPIQVWHEDLDSIHANIWKKWSHENNIKFINYFPDIVRLGISRVEQLQILKKYYIPGDLHFNRAGNKLVAQKFLNVYQNNLFHEMEIENPPND